MEKKLLVPLAMTGGLSPKALRPSADDD